MKPNPNIYSRVYRILPSRKLPLLTGPSKYLRRRRKDHEIIAKQVSLSNSLLEKYRSTCFGPDANFVVLQASFNMLLSQVVHRSL